MVDPKDLRFFEYGMYHLGQRSSRLKVRAEWLLDDHPGPLGQLGLAEHVDDGPERGRRHGEVEQPPRAAADLLLGFLYRRDQRLGIVRVGRAEMQLALERLPRRSSRLGQAELRDGRLRMLAELLIGHRELGRR